MKLRTGQKLRSAVCEAQLVVVRAPEADIELSCGGVPVLDDGQEADGTASLDPSLGGDGPLLGKRYADDETGLELLCTRAGQGALTVDARPLPVKGAKPLPSSD